MRAQHAWKDRGSVIARKALLYYGFCDDPLAGLEEGRMSGSVPFDGGETISIRSADANCDQLNFFAWVWKYADISRSRFHPKETVIAASKAV